MRADVTAAIFMCVFGSRGLQKTVHCEPAHARSAGVIIRASLRTPKGLFEVWADDWSLVENYRFGTRSCDFLICRRCGVFIAAVSELTAEPQAVVNVNCLSDRERFTSAPIVHDFEDETIETRLSRRAANWMPAIVHRSEPVSSPR